MKVLFIGLTILFSGQLLSAEFQGSIYKPFTGDINATYSPEALINISGDTVTEQTIFPDGDKHISISKVIKKNGGYIIGENVYQTVCTGTQFQKPPFAVDENTPIFFKIDNNKVSIQVDATELKLQLQTALTDPAMAEHKQKIKEYLDKINENNILEDEVGEIAKEEHVQRFNSTVEGC